MIEDGILRRRLPEIGRIRAGEKVPSGGDGQTRPAKLETWKLTSSSRLAIFGAAEVHGGEPRRYRQGEGQVLTETAELDVLVPPQDVAGGQSFELWQGGTIERRCTGSELEGGSEFRGPGDECRCDPDLRDCKLKTRLLVVLPRVPGLGVWRLETTSYHAAAELPGMVEFLVDVVAGGGPAPAVLALQQREKKVRLENGRVELRKFAVPTLVSEETVDELAAKASGADGFGLPGRTSRHALGSGSPVPANELEGSPA